MGKKRRWYLHLFFFPIDRFPRQQHVTPLKLRHVAAILFKKKKFNFESFFLKKIKIKLSVTYCNFNGAMCR
jgi:hypothetical protein